MADELLFIEDSPQKNSMKPTFQRCAHRPILSIAAILFALASGCAASGGNGSDPGTLGQPTRGAAYQGQPVALILPHPSTAWVPYRPMVSPYDPNFGAQVFQVRDATDIVPAILMRELSSAGYQPRLGNLRDDAGEDLGVRYEITRVWTTQMVPGMWPTPGYYRATVSSHVAVFRGDLDCMAQSYFVHGEGPSAWSAFSRALDGLMRQSVPEMIGALAACGAPLAPTK